MTRRRPRIAAMARAVCVAATENLKEVFTEDAGELLEYQLYGYGFGTPAGGVIGAGAGFLIGAPTWVVVLGLTSGWAVRNVALSIGIAAERVGSFRRDLDWRYHEERRHNEDPEQTRSADPPFEQIVEKVRRELDAGTLVLPKPSTGQRRTGTRMLIGERNETIGMSNVRVAISGVEGAVIGIVEVRTPAGTTAPPAPVITLQYSKTLVASQEAAQREGFGEAGEQVQLYATQPLVTPRYGQVRVTTAFGDSGPIQLDVMAPATRGLDGSSAGELGLNSSADRWSDAQVERSLRSWSTTGPNGKLC